MNDKSNVQWKVVLRRLFFNAYLLFGPPLSILVYPLVLNRFAWGSVQLSAMNSLFYTYPAFAFWLAARKNLFSTKNDLLRLSVCISTYIAGLLAYSYLESNSRHSFASVSYRIIAMSLLNLWAFWLALAPTVFLWRILSRTPNESTQQVSIRRFIFLTGFVAAYVAICKFFFYSDLNSLTRVVLLPATHLPHAVSIVAMAYLLSRSWKYTAPAFAIACVLNLALAWLIFQAYPRLMENSGSIIEFWNTYRFEYLLSQTTVMFVVLFTAKMLGESFSNTTSLATPSRTGSLHQS